MCSSDLARSLIGRKGGKEESIGRTPYDINHSKILFDPLPGEMDIKTKINKWDLMKVKNFCTAKESKNKMKR